MVRNQEVRGSIPLRSIYFFNFLSMRTSSFINKTTTFSSCIKAYFLVTFGHKLVHFDTLYPSVGHILVTFWSQLPPPIDRNNTPLYARVSRLPKKAVVFETGLICFK